MILRLIWFFTHYYHPGYMMHHLPHPKKTNGWNLRGKSFEPNLQCLAFQPLVFGSEHPFSHNHGSVENYLVFHQVDFLLGVEASQNVGASVQEYVHSISCPTCRCLHPLEVPSLSSASTMSVTWWNISFLWTFCVDRGLLEGLG